MSVLTSISLSTLLAFFSRSPFPLYKSDRLNMATIRLLFLVIPALVRAEELSPYYTLSWTVERSHVTFDIQARTLGWVGLGFNSVESMKGADLVVAGVKNGGDNFVYDLHGVTTDKPPPDSSQDYHVVKSSQNSTHTNLSIRRKLDTGDSDDFKLSVGSSLIVLYAIGHDTDTPKDIYTFSAHAERDTKSITFK